MQCQHPEVGDSGDAIIIDHNDKWTDIGITSQGAVYPQATDCTQGAAFFYTNLTNPVFLKFIKDTIKS